MDISAVINTHNEEKNITRCLKSVIPYVNEVVVVDMGSTDETVALAKQYTDKIWTHEYVGYVEPARNFAISKAVGKWILLVDADEVLPDDLGQKLRKLVGHNLHDYYRIPRKNLNFGKWMRHTGWWPDYQIRFFKKGAVVWSDDIHSIPVTHGKGVDLVADEKNALVHHNYQTISQFIDRLNRYSSQEAKQKVRAGYNFEWKNLLLKPGSEFMSRFFVWEGFKDGLHGLALSLLQSFSFLVVELKVWEEAKFNQYQNSNYFDQVMSTIQLLRRQIYFWYFSKKSEKSKGMTKIFHKIRAKGGI